MNDYYISYQELCDYKWVSKLMFFANFCEHLNELNVKLQGGGNALDVMFGYIEAFEKNKSFRKILEMRDLDTFQTSRGILMISKTMTEQIVKAF